MSTDVKSAVAIRHIAFEDFGVFAPVFSAAGFKIDYVDVAERDLRGAGVSSGLAWTFLS